MSGRNAAGAPGSSLSPAELSTLEDVVTETRKRLKRDRRVRRKLPGDGKVFIDGLTPFLAICRLPPRSGSPPGAASLVSSLRSYLLVPREHPRVGRRVLERIPDVVVNELGAALIVELWIAARSAPDGEPPGLLRVRTTDTDGPTAADFVAALSDVRVAPENEMPPGGDRATVEVTGADRPAPPDEPSLVPDTGPEPVAWVGIEVAPVYVDPDSGEVYPHRLQLLRRELSLGLERALHAWASRCTRFEGAHPHNLGRRTLGRSGRAIDSRLADVATAFDLIIGVSPVNVEEMWERFDACGGERAPRFRYRPLTFDPEELKRSLFQVPIERIEDPLTARLIREKQEELDLRISMLRNRGRRDFLLQSLQLFGSPDEELVALGRQALQLHPPSGTASCPDEPIDADGFVDLARKELERLGSGTDGFPHRIEVRDDLASSIVVTHGVLCVSPRLSLTPRRAEALVQHEVGTHLLTWFNGGEQDLRLLRTGLAGYGTLQEGLAVLAEYLVGGLTPGRIRTLGARVVAVNALVEGADFVETHRLLSDDLGFAPRRAFAIAVRVYRGGGFTKDLQYLQGLRDVLQYLRTGGDAATLCVGKVGLGHIETVRELALRGIIRPPVVLPRYMKDTAALHRLEECRTHTVLDLFEEVEP